MGLDGAGRVSANHDDALLDELLGRFIDDLAAGRTIDLDAVLPERPDLRPRLHAVYALAQQIAVRRPAPAQPPAPRTIGPYRLLELRGEGGMGSVWVAVQHEPIARRVALKLIKQGMASKQVLARFDAERQALSMMSHPCIAKVFDAGTTPDGQPWFAMELVPGDPLHVYCDKQRLAIGDRLLLFAQVCQAVQHAHQKGVIHRDLKPQNVLVMLVDGKPVPKVIDFGVAKALDKSLTEETLYTEQGQVIGTPEYMSPEQAEMSGAGVDARTDIYSLGVMLYELLTGALPFDPRELRRAGLLEMRRRIREEEPPKPSTRLSQLGEATTSHAMLRRTEASALIRRLRGDLDWICGKAMEKDPARRYASASELAADVERHLRHEPVLAAAPSAGYRLHKLVRRHRGPLAAALAVLLALVVGLMATWWQYLEAVGAKQAEKARADEAKHNLEKFLQMRDVPIVEDLLREADEDLWPAHPDKMAQMERWLQRAREIEARLPGHRAALHELRAKALPMSEELRSEDQELAALRKEQDEKRALLDKAKGSPRESAKRRIPDLADEVADGESRLLERVRKFEAKRWQFASFEDRFLHATLANLVPAIEALVDHDRGPAASVASRLRDAGALIERSIGDERGSEAARRAAAAWREVSARLARDARFAGFVLRPQLGLVPLGPDPGSLLEEFAHLLSGEPAVRDEQGKLEVGDHTGIVLVLIPGGTFWMGAQSEDPTRPNYDPHALPEESPVHAVPLEPYLIAKDELTQGQWLCIAGNNPSHYAAGARLGGRTITLCHPVENVSWNDCTRILASLALVLPTEAQWERAARAGTSGSWWTGSDKRSLAEAANVCDASYKAKQPTSTLAFDADLDDGYVVHAPVGSFRANGFGLRDVIGNVAEWCADTYDRDAYRALTTGNATSVSNDIRVIRGGSHSMIAEVARSARRIRDRSNVCAVAVGCRPARPITR